MSIGLAVQGNLGMDCNRRQRDLILRGVFELTITHAEDNQLRAEASLLDAGLGGDPEVMFFGVAPQREA